MYCSFYYFDAFSNATPPTAWIFKDVAELQSWKRCFLLTHEECVAHSYGLLVADLGCWLIRHWSNQSNRHHYTQNGSYLFKVLNIIMAFIQLMLCSSKGTICVQGTTRAFAPMWWADTCRKVPGGSGSSVLSISWLGFMWWFPKFKTGGKLQPHWPLRDDSYERYLAKEIDIISIQFSTIQALSGWELRVGTH